MSEEIKLKQCPFCGNEPRSEDETESTVHRGNSFPEFVECIHCNIRFVGGNAKNYWNRRVN